MSQRSRLGLTDLASIRKDLVKTTVPPHVPEAVPNEVPPEPELVSSGGQAIQRELKQAVPEEVPRVLLERKEKRRLVSQSFKLPADLDDRWTRVATYNRVTKTAILLEGLETLLDRLPQPPDQGNIGNT